MSPFARKISKGVVFSKKEYQLAEATKQATIEYITVQFMSNFTFMKSSSSVAKAW